MPNTKRSTSTKPASERDAVINAVIEKLDELGAQVDVLAMLADSGNVDALKKQSLTTALLTIGEGIEAAQDQIAFARVAQ